MLSSFAHETGHIVVYITLLNKVPKIEISIFGIKMINDIKNEKHYAFYDELEEDNKKISNIIKFDKDFIEVTRKGAVNTKLNFKLNETNQSLYSTPFGDMLIEVFTKNISLNEKEADVNLLVDYEMFIDGDKVSDNKIEINIQHNN